MCKAHSPATGSKGKQNGRAGTLKRRIWAVAQQTKAKGQVNYRGIIGFVVFVVGIALAVIVGLTQGVSAPANGNVILVLVVLGILIGLLNITAKEAIPMMIAAIALIVVGQAGFLALNDVTAGLGDRINHMVSYFSQLMAPAAVISAVRALLSFGFPGD